MASRTAISCAFIIVSFNIIATNNIGVAATASTSCIQSSPNSHAAFSTTPYLPQQRRRRGRRSTIQIQQNSHRRYLRHRPPLQPSKSCTRCATTTSSTAIASSPIDLAAPPPLLEYVANTAASATESALEYVSSTVARETIHRAPILSLTISFILGGIFFSTIAAAFAGVIALGKENTRRLREVVAIVIRRNWSVMKISMTFTMVSGHCLCVLFNRIDHKMLHLIICFYACSLPKSIMLHSISSPNHHRMSSVAKRKCPDSKTDSRQHCRPSEKELPK